MDKRELKGEGGDEPAVEEGTHTKEVAKLGR